MQRIHLKSSDLNDSFLELDSSQYHHLFNVCRLKNGSKLECVIDSTRLIIVSITEIKKNGFSFVIVDQFSSVQSRRIAVDLIQSLPKQDKLTEACKLCTEIGVSNIFPVITEYCDVTTLSENKIKRIHSSIDSAAKQSKQLAIPRFHSLMPLNDLLLLKQWEAYDVLLIAYEGATLHLSDIIQTPSDDIHSICIAIGPEGGYSSVDLDRFKAHGFQQFSLGSSIFRTEHAGFAAINYIDGFLSNI